MSKQCGWWVYIIRSEVDGRLYTGVSTDPDRRVGEHNWGKRGAKATRRGRPWSLVYVEFKGDVSTALRREKAIKKLSRPKKLRLVGV
jgi:putative endonuclease